MDSRGRVVVVGAGLAGLGTATALRQQGHTGPLTLVGAEARPPYDRPPLSKAVLLGEADASTLEADWAALRVDLQLGRRATGLREGVLETDAGELPWDGLVIATGSRARRVPGTDTARVLRTHDESLALRERLRPDSRLVIVGAGWVSAEVATAAVRAGTRVTVVEALDAPLAGVLPREVTDRMMSWWDAVDLRLGTRVVGAEPGVVHLDDGERLPADTVLVAVGAQPESGWLDGSGVEFAEGGAVAVDEALRTSLPGVLAVGDVMAWQSVRFGTRLHIEHWDTALHSPTSAAATLLGQETVYDPVPYFWSEQWGRMVQYVGYHLAGERLVWRDGGDTWSAFWLAGDRLVAALTVDRHHDLMQARRLVASGRPVDPARLADPATPVKAAAISPTG